MDKFLSQLYQEEMDKQAAADLKEFLLQQPMNDLESMLGIKKQAVAQPHGDVEAPLPDSLPGKKLDEKMKLLDTFVAKSRGEEPPTREQAAEVGKVNYAGPSTLAKKISPHHPADGKPAHDPTEKHASIQWADQMGRKLAAAACAAKMKKSQGVGDAAGMGMAGQGASQGITSLGGLGDTGVGEDKTAIACAKIASVALNSVQGAPEGIRKVAAALAGRKIAAARGSLLGLQEIGEAAPPNDLERESLRLQQEREESTPRQVGRGALMGGLIGAGVGGMGMRTLAQSPAVPKALMSIVTPQNAPMIEAAAKILSWKHSPLLAALIGGGLGAGVGAGVGASKAKGARQRHEALNAVQEGEVTPEMAPALENQRRKEDVLRQAISGAVKGGVMGPAIHGLGGAVGMPVSQGLSTPSMLMGAGLGALKGVHSARDEQKRRMAIMGE